MIETPPASLLLDSREHMTEKSPFQGILDGTQAAHFILRNERYAAFLEKKPLKQGHVVVLPLRHIDFVFDLEDEEIAGLFVFAGTVARAVRDSIPCKKVGMAVIGLEVRHAHLHLVPIDSGAELNFTLPRQTFSEDAFARTAEQIRAKLPDESSSGRL